MKLGIEQKVGRSGKILMVEGLGMSKICKRDFPAGPVDSDTPSAGGPGSIPDQRTRPHMLQLKILHAVAKT